MLRPEDRELAFCLLRVCQEGLKESCGEIMSGWPGGLCDSKVAEALKPAKRAKLTLWPGQKAWRTFPGPRPACLGGFEWKKGGEDGSESFFPGPSFADCRINKPLHVSWSESPSPSSLSSTLFCFPSLTPKPLQKVAFDQ